MPRVIQANYDDLASVATRFAQESNQTEQMVQRIAQCVDQLESGGWIGRGAQAFYSEMNDEVFPALRRLCQALEDSSSAIRRISDMLSQAEQEASSIFSRNR